MSKELSPLEALYLIDTKFVHKEWNNKPRETEKCFDIVETALKALEIIKKKRVNVQALFYSSSCDDYNKHYNHYEDLTQEEYELLKDVLL